MINDFNCGVVGWTDWNILLDENGVTNQVPNLCFSPIHDDLATEEFIYTRSYELFNYQIIIDLLIRDIHHDGVH